MFLKGSSFDAHESTFPSPTCQLEFGTMDKLGRTAQAPASTLQSNQSPENIESVNFKEWILFAQFSAFWLWPKLGWEKCVFSPGEVSTTFTFAASEEFLSHQTSFEAKVDWENMEVKSVPVPVCLSLSLSTSLPLFFSLCLFLSISLSPLFFSLSFSYFFHSSYKSTVLLPILSFFCAFVSTWIL